MTNTHIAAREMTRLKGARAWSPLAKARRRKLNSDATRYTFVDGSQLTIYTSGDAAYFYRDANGNTDGLQRWKNWHHCNTQGR